MSVITKGQFTDLSAVIGTVASMNVVPQNSVRQYLEIQNVSASNNLAFSYDNTTPAINTAGSFMLTPGQARILDVAVATNQINFIASGVNTPVTIKTME